MSFPAFSTYTSYMRFCERLELAARRKPAFGFDPILRFTRATSKGCVIEWRHCGPVGDRMQELAADRRALGEMTRPAHCLAGLLRAAADTEMPFCMN